MNKKLLAVAVAGTLAAPMALADVSTSGSIRVGVEASDGDWAVVNGGSRLRFKASEDLGNGKLHSQRTSSVSMLPVAVLGAAQPTALRWLA